jgi:molybdopterin-guanine dinucleotide biosynthesis adapter protein
LGRTKVKIISVVGWHNAGKTLVVERLVIGLKALGLKVATIKHTRADINVDTPGTDTWRFDQAGSDLVIIAGGPRTVLMERRDQEESLESLLRRVPRHIDLVITEGYKREAYPKIEVRRAEVGGEPISAPNELVAIVSDDAQTNAGAAPVIGFEDTQALIQVLQRWGIVPQSS